MGHERTVLRSPPVDLEEKKLSIPKQSRLRMNTYNDNLFNGNVDDFILCW